jgi:hypothetical protein
MEGPNKPDQQVNNFSYYFIFTIFYAIWHYITSIYDRGHQLIFSTTVEDSGSTTQDDSSQDTPIPTEGDDNGDAAPTDNSETIIGDEKEATTQNPETDGNEGDKDTNSDTISVKSNDEQEGNQREDVTPTNPIINHTPFGVESDTPIDASSIQAPPSLLDSASYDGIPFVGETAETPTGSANWHEHTHGNDDDLTPVPEVTNPDLFKDNATYERPLGEDFNPHVDPEPDSI